jgi:hypothetical protein
VAATGRHPRPCVDATRERHDVGPALHGENVAAFRTPDAVVAVCHRARRMAARGRETAGRRSSGISTLPAIASARPGLTHVEQVRRRAGGEPRRQLARVISVGIAGYLARDHQRQRRRPRDASVRQCPARDPADGCRAAPARTRRSAPRPGLQEGL